MRSLLNPETLAARAAQIGEGQVPPELTLRLGVEIRGLWMYTVSFKGGQISVEEGLDCDISVHLGEETALEIASGRMNAQQAIDSGNLKLAGELRMIPLAKALSTLGALLSETDGDSLSPKVWQTFHAP
ncbi:MAG: SCP2 sterol-binding domain-containing protein [Actinomycetes bacterium]